jgi:hypothetical protein
MTEKKFKRVEFEREPGEDFDTLRFSLRVPKPKLPEETGSHFRSAEREMLLAARTLIDELVERMGRYGTKGASAKDTSQEPAEDEK